MKRLSTLLLLLAILLAGCVYTPIETQSLPKDESVYSNNISETDNGNVLPNNNRIEFDLSEIPEFSGEPYIAINNNIPYFSKNELVTESYEQYEKLDYLGRCGVTVACIGKDIMPTEPRGEIGSIKPTGWQISKYDSVDGKYLYNRCHLIGFQLTGENANECNLITGTRYMNVQGMLPFENMVAEYVEDTDNHVMYRVTPIFDGENLVAHGVLMEAYSVEDNGKGICFNVFCYNVQPRIAIDYATGDNEYAGIDDYEIEGEITYILNKNSKKFHYPNCSSVDKITENNRAETTKSRSVLISEGYSPCGSCNP